LAYEPADFAESDYELSSGHSLAGERFRCFGYHFLDVPFFFEFDDSSSYVSGVFADRRLGYAEEACYFVLFEFVGLDELFG